MPIMPTPAQAQVAQLLRLLNIWVLALLCGRPVMMKSVYG